MCRQIGGTVLMALAVAASACSASETPTSPAAPTPASLRIIGIPESSSKGVTIDASAEVVFRDGTRQPCAAVWTTEDARVAHITPGGRITTDLTGYSRIGASCSGVEAIHQLRVEAPVDLDVSLIILDEETNFYVARIFDAEILDGPNAGRTGRIRNGIELMALGVDRWPTRVRLSAEFYEPVEVLIAETAGTRRNPNARWFDFWMWTKYAAPAGIDTHVVKLNLQTPEMVFPIHLGTAGTVDVRTWWDMDVNDRTVLDLSCGGQVIVSRTQVNSFGEGVTASAPAGDCAVKIRSNAPGNQPQYRIAIRYPR